MSEAPRTPVNPRNTVRLRLLIIALLPILILLPLFLATTVTNWKEQLNQVLTAKVSNELTVARQHLNGLTERRSAAISALARSAEFRKLMNDTAVLSNYLEGQRIRLGFDFLYYVTPDGNVVQGGSYMALPDQRNWPVVNAALNGQMRASIDVMNQRDMLALSPAMASRAAVELIATQGAAPSTRTEETRGMVVHAAAPAPGGAVVGGLLLNRNLGFIDEINDLVYPEGSLTGGGLGTATLFLDDVRVSTNVR
ncbi:MAG: two-component sensor histidine kinase, partial [Pseudomonadota bacterium]|nr:two-component sensor histidine kinase [Pseudomonadota bacterium]